MKDSEEVQGQGGLDWLEASMDPTERERMLALPDRSPESRGEVERRQAIERTLESLSTQRAPDGLWSDICRRIETEPAPPARPFVAMWRRPLTGVAAALFLAVTTWFVTSEIDPFGWMSSGGDPAGPGDTRPGDTEAGNADERRAVEWVIVDGDAFDRANGRTASSSIASPSPKPTEP